MYLDIFKIKHIIKAINSETINDILTLAKTAPKSDGKVAKFINGEYVRFNSEQCTAKLVHHNKFQNKIDDLVDHCATLVKEQFGLNCISNTTDFVYYPTGTKYWPHIDGQSLEGNVVSRGNIKRDITCIVYLNEDYSGGELYFQFFGNKYRPSSGDIIMYPSNWPYIHGVESVVGERYAFVIWFETDPHAYSLEDEIITDPRTLRILSAQQRLVP